MRGNRFDPVNILGEEMPWHYIGGPSIILLGLSPLKK
tara:strand:+ start:883 stop:993 length:111 start_codon:yes stop_codon:yes gene_type:complete